MDNLMSSSQMTAFTVRMLKEARDAGLLHPSRFIWIAQTGAARINPPLLKTKMAQRKDSNWRIPREEARDNRQSIKPAPKVARTWRRVDLRNHP